jgi:hypothetical protein
MLASGEDMALVSKRMGHSSSRTTVDLYSHLQGNVGHESAEKSRALVQREVDARSDARSRDQSVTSGPPDAESVVRLDDKIAGQGPA